MAHPVGTDAIVAFNAIGKFRAAPFIKRALDPALACMLIQIILEYANTCSCYLHRPLFHECGIPHTDSSEPSGAHFFDHYYYKGLQNQHMVVSSWCHWTNLREPRSHYLSLICLDTGEEEVLERGRRGHHTPHRLLYDGKNEFIFLHFNEDATRLNVSIERPRKKYPLTVELSDTTFFERDRFEKAALWLRKEKATLTVHSAAYDPIVQSFLILTNSGLFFSLSESTSSPKTLFHKISLEKPDTHFVAGVDVNKLVAVEKKGLYFVDHFRDPEKRRMLYGLQLPDNETYGYSAVDPNHTHLFVVSTKRNEGKVVSRSIKMFAFPKMDYRREFPIENPETWGDTFAADDSTLIMRQNDTPSTSKLHFWDLASGDCLSVITCARGFAFPSLWNFQCATFRNFQHKDGIYAF